jgi:hypothetical protein
VIRAATAVLVLASALGAAAEPAYEAGHTAAAGAVLLDPEADAWKTGASIAWGPPEYETSFRALWNDQGLAVRFESVDPDPWHTLTARDAHLWTEEVVEIFLDVDRSGTHYTEVEINPSNVVCDFHILHPLPMSPGDPEWKGDIGWDWEGLVSRTGLRRDGERTTGWVATAFLPWNGLRTLPSAQHVNLPPCPGDRWRFNVFRIERPYGPSDPERGVILAAWSPASIPKFHVASVFRDIVFK